MRFEFRMIDFIDIALVALFLFLIYKKLQGSSAMKLFVGILSFVVVWLVVSFLFQMPLLGAIMNQIVNVGAIAIIVLFQDEIRRFFTMLGSNRSFLARFLGLFSSDKTEGDIYESHVMQIVIACKNMAREKVGALIVIQREDDLSSVVITGDVINADINSRLIENIFFKNSPLHDGAIIISDKKIEAACCILPVTRSLEVPKSLGLRHRAALGISEKTDCLAIIVSEETGQISVAEKGKFSLHLTQEDLKTILNKSMNVTKGENDKS